MIIWLASFPKSGNTWLRSIISSLIYSDDGIFNFELNKKIKQFPSIPFFQDLTQDYNNIHEIKKLWILAQDRLNLDNKLKFLKTHHINYEKARGRRCSHRHRSQATWAWS